MTERSDRTAASRGDDHRDVETSHDKLRHLLQAAIRRGRRDRPFEGEHKWNDDLLGHEESLHIADHVLDVLHRKGYQIVPRLRQG